MNKKKKIAFFGIKYFPSRGGTSRVAENLIRNMVEDYELTIYCFRHPQAKGYIAGVKVVQLPELPLGSLGVFLYYFMCYLHIRFWGTYDIVHAHKIDSFFFLNGLAKKTKVIATAHEAPYKRDKWGKVARAFFRMNEKRFLQFKGVKTAISKPLCDYYKEQNQIDVAFIANGINISDIRNENNVSKFWPDQLKGSTPFVLFAARRIMGTKGLHTMLSAYKKLNYDGDIFVAGELDNYPAYIDKVKELSKGLNVHFLGFVSPLPSLLALVERCEYFVFPSETEGMSIMLLEVATTGKPILASDIPENTQVFNSDEVLYFENKNVDDLAEKIRWLEENKPSAEMMAARAKEKVSSHYTWVKIVKEYKRLYEMA